ncbi:hypothetical protein AMTRI_Chr13g89290 [Amborella trichopoda]
MIYYHHIVHFPPNLIFSLNSNTLDHIIPVHCRAPTLNIPRICQRSRILHFRKPNILRNPKSLA